MRTGIERISTNNEKTPIFVDFSSTKKTKNRKNSGKIHATDKEMMISFHNYRELPSICGKSCVFFQQNRRKRSYLWINSIIAVGIALRLPEVRLRAVSLQSQQCTLKRKRPALGWSLHLTAVGIEPTTTSV